jgi:hypothetical protein
MDSTARKTRESRLVHTEPYADGKPIPHRVVDGYFAGAELDALERAWPAEDWEGWFHMQSWKEDKWASRTGAAFPRPIQDFLARLNSSAFVRYLEQTTGIERLIPDPHFHGGGLHLIKPGGFLQRHRDFNWHKELHLVRRVNVLVYLNPTWKEEWGGHLELAYPVDNAIRISPMHGRMVILDTQAPGWHGHPDPLQTPPGVFRRSLAAYYYTAGKVDTEKGTEYKELVPGQFRKTAKDRLEALAKSWCPPALLDLKRKALG